MSSFSQPHNVKSYLLANLIMEHPLVQHNKLWKQLFLIHKQEYNKLIIICYHNIYTVHCYHNIYTVHEIIMDEIVRVFHACIKDLHEHFRILLINSKEVSDVQRIKKIHTQTTMFNFCEKRVYIKIWCWLNDSDLPAWRWHFWGSVLGAGGLGNATTWFSWDHQR